MRKLVNFKARLLTDGDSMLFKQIYRRRWWGILSVAAQRAVALNLEGGDFAPAVEMLRPSDEELLCTTIAAPAESRMR